MDELYSNESINYCQNIVQKVKTILGSIVELAFIYSFFTYIGKIIVYMYCYGTCEQSEKNKCACYNYVTNQSYWIDFRYSVLEALLAILFYNIFNKICN